MVMLLELDRARARRIRRRVVETEIPFTFEFVAGDQEVIRTGALIETCLDRVRAAIEVTGLHREWLERPGAAGTVEVSAMGIDALVRDPIRRIGRHDVLEGHRFIE